MILKLAFVELWNPEYHGVNNNNINLEGRYLSIEGPITLDEFYSLESNDFIQTNDANNRTKSLEIVSNYSIGDYILCKVLTNRIKYIQRLWRNNNN